MTIQQEPAVAPSKLDHGVRLTSAVLASVPFLATGLLLVFAWHTSRVTGTWPTYANPDPNSANTALYLASGVAILASLPSVITLVIGLPAVRRLKLNRLDIGLLAIALVGLVVFYFVFAGNLGDWYMD